MQAGQTIKTENNKSFIVEDKMIICLFTNKSYFKKEIIMPEQVHGDNIVFVRDEKENLEGTDGVFTENKDMVLGIGTRDCAPICMTDGDRIGIVHVGWKGLVNGIFDKMASNFNGMNLIVYVGPFLHSFEIQRDFCYWEINSKMGNKFFETREKKLFFNFYEALKSVLPKDTIWDDRNTKDDISLPSNRRGSLENFTTAVKFFNKTE